MRIAGCRRNVSASMPLGLYQDIERPLLVGEIVAVCLPPAIATFGHERGYLGRGECEDGTQPVLKRIAAVEGDTVDVQGDAVTISFGGSSVAKPRRLAHSEVLDRDSRGRALPHVPWGPYTLQHGELWLMSTSRPNSWDSRYFGPISVTDVIATTCPAVTATVEGIIP
jgi:conjugative transfer signal peptidase TraF